MAYSQPEQQGRPYEQGYMSGIAGHDPRVCPYGYMTTEWRDWICGQRRGAALKNALEDSSTQ